MIASAAVMMMWLVTVKVVGNEPDHVQRQDEHEDREHEGKKPHAFGAGGRAHHGGDEFVGQLGRRLQARGHQARRSAVPITRNGGQADHRDQHEGGRIGEGDLGVADLAERKQVDDLELVDGVDGHDRYRSSRSDVSRARRRPRASRSEPRRQSRATETRSAPTAKFPASDRAASPINAPTSTPATSSVDSRKPRANAEASAVLTRTVARFRMVGSQLSSRSPRRWSLAERAASSSGGSLRSPLPRVPSAMLSTRVAVKGLALPRRPKSRADHTDRVSLSQETRSRRRKSLKSDVKRKIFATALREPVCTAA